MRLRLDPWAAEYNTAFLAELQGDDTTGKTNVDVTPEHPADGWQAITPTHADTLWDELFFIDGSRRSEARVLVEDDSRELAFGALGSCAVGAVRCCSRGQRAAVFDSLELQRICALSSGFDTPAFIIHRALGSHLGELHYTTLCTYERDVDAVLRKLQGEMLAAEKRLAARLLHTSPGALILCDGPRPFLGADENLLGYVKTIHEVKVGPEQLRVVRGLEQGQRSPVYLVQPEGGEHGYFEWFLRLRDPRPWLYTLAGMVRLQAAAGPDPAGRLAVVCHLADWTALNLPRFASRQHQDPRAPQQLLPIRALEAELGRRMGSAPLIRRRITRYLSDIATPLPSHPPGGAS